MNTKISDNEAKEFLAEHKDWAIKSGMLERTFKFDSFLDCISFVQTVAMAAEEADHHPDMDVRFDKLTVKWVTHDVKGLSGKDLQLAHACDELFNSPAFSGVGEVEPPEELPEGETPSPVAATSFRRGPIVG